MKEPLINVRAGELKVAEADATLVTIGLGSCVAVALYDPEARIGGLAHVMLPDPSSSRDPTPVGRFGSTAVSALLTSMEDAGADRTRVMARLVGGAAMFANVLSGKAKTLGTRNVEAVRDALDRVAIPIAGEDVGGGHGRTVHFHVHDGKIRVSSIRHGDVQL